MKKNIKAIAAFEGIVQEWLTGTSLEGGAVEVLNYEEDGEWNVAVDIVGKTCDADAYVKLRDKMQNIGLLNVERVEESVLPADEGVRIYSTSGKVKLCDIVSGCERKKVSCRCAK